MPEFIPLVAAVRDVFMSLVMVLFVLSTLLLMLVILIQEGKGGGITGVFGGGFTETFGVKAGTVNKFTAYVAAAFLVLALLYAGLSAKDAGTKITPLPNMPADTSPAELPGASSPVPPATPEQPGGGAAPGAGEQPGGPPPAGGTPPAPPSGSTPEPPPQTPPKAPEQPPAPPAGEQPR